MKTAGKKIQNLKVGSTWNGYFGIVLIYECRSNKIIFVVYLFMKIIQCNLKIAVKEWCLYRDFLPAEYQDI